MIKGFSVEDGSILFGLLAEGAGDILLRTDAKGFITEASPGLEAFGLKLEEMLFEPHVADLVRPCHTERIRHYCNDVLAGMPIPERIEFPVAGGDGSRPAERWFALSLRPVRSADNEIIGSVGIMRAIEARRSIEDELLVASMTDQITGLANRHALLSIMSRFLGHGSGGALVLFGIDRFRGITLQYGQSKSDEVLWAFAQFLRAMLGEEPILTRTEGERFAVILSDCDALSASQLAQETVETFAQISGGQGKADFRVSASAGVAAMAGERDAVLAAAELGLTLAQAAGGVCARIGGDVPILVEQRRSA